MSSTNRGGERSEADFYPTPEWVTRLLLDHVPLPGGHWIEPSAGDGAIIRAVGEERTDVTWTACELRDECVGFLSVLPGVEAVRVGNFLSATPEWLGVPTDHAAWARRVVVANPPFRHAMEFVQHSFDVARTVVMLLRLNFLGTEDRNTFMTSMPPDVYVIPDRVSFTGGNATDSIEHAWFVWEGMRVRQHGALKVLPTTPADVRKGPRIHVPPLIEQRELFADNDNG